ncbi:ATP-binding protein, partial [Micromonospora sp. CPCC 205561]
CPAPGGEPAGGPPPPGEAVGEVDGLPRRVRRRGPVARPRRPAVDAPGARPSAGDAPGRRSVLDGPTVRQPVIDSPAPRSPEEARRTMSALQSGTARGRAAAARPAPETAADPSPTPAERPADPEPMTATERDA